MNFRGTTNLFINEVRAYVDKYINMVLGHREQWYLKFWKWKWLKKTDLPVT